MIKKSMKNSIGRPKTFEKEDVIKLAMNHFWEHGYEGTNLDDLLVAMGIKKSSFYRTFKSKEEVFYLSLELYKKETFLLLEQLKSSLFGVSLTIPITNGQLNLGTWQGIYLGEHRDYGGSRKIVATIMGN